MNINEFKEKVAERIVKRGYEYYVENRIIELYMMGENHYGFLVQGNYEYNVEVQIDKKGEILYSDCDCPYDFGTICKHQIAAYFKILESSKQKVKEEFNIEDILKNLSKEELIQIITDLMKRDYVLKNSLALKYSKCDKKEEIQKCKNFIKMIRKKYTSFMGIIEEEDVNGFLTEIRVLLDKVKYQNNYLISLEIIFLVLEELMSLYEESYDGDVEELIIKTINMMRELVIKSKEASLELRIEMFDEIMKNLENDSLKIFEVYKIEIMEICIEFADILKIRKVYKNKIELLIKENRSEIKTSYKMEKYLEILLEILEKYYTEAEVEKFLEKNIKHDSIRRKVIEKYREEKNYHKVIELALEGENKYKCDFIPKIEWKKLRYESYKKLAMKKEQKKLAKELLFCGDFRYYREIKTLNKGDQNEVYQELKKKLKKSQDLRSEEIYLKLILIENDLKELMEFVKENIETIEIYADKLKVKYNDEVVEVYINYIENIANKASKRSSYKKVCKVINNYKKIFGYENTIKLIDELKNKYGRKTAFIDELSKIRDSD